jgi:hypothetical protein
MQHNEVTIVFQGMFIATLNSTVNPSRFEVRPLSLKDHHFSVFINTISSSNVIVPLGQLVELNQDVTISVASANPVPAPVLNPGDSSNESSTRLIDMMGINNVTAINQGTPDMPTLGPRFHISAGTLFTAALLPGSYHLVEVKNSKPPTAEPQVGGMIGIDIKLPIDAELDIFQTGSKVISLSSSGGMRYEILASNVRSQAQTTETTEQMPGQGAALSDFNMYYQALVIDSGDPYRYDLAQDPIQVGAKNYTLVNGFPVVCNGIYLSLPGGLG